MIALQSVKTKKGRGGGVSECTPRDDKTTKITAGVMKGTDIRGGRHEEVTTHTPALNKRSPRHKASLSGPSFNQSCAMHAGSIPCIARFLQHQTLPVPGVFPPVLPFTHSHPLYSSSKDRYAKQ